MKLFRLFLFGLVAVFGISTNAPLAAKSPPAPTQEHIAERIKVLTGLDALVSMTGTESVDLSKLNIPFLTPSLRGRQGIKVSFTKGILRFPHQNPPVMDPYERTFTVYLDETGDHVIAVYARLAEPRPNTPPEIPLQTAQDQLRANEIYTAFPKVAPRLTFLQALEAANSAGPGTCSAKEIDAFYVMRSNADEKPRPAWVIQLRGVGGFLGVPDNNYWRDVVDATTGECQGSNFPGGPSPDEHRHEPANDLAGSQWGAIPSSHTHPGLVSNLTFSKDTVAPQGYQYDVNGDNSITIHFNHGGTFLMLLSGDGRRLTGIFNNQKYEYERVSN